MHLSTRALSLSSAALLIGFLAIAALGQRLPIIEDLTPDPPGAPLTLLDPPAPPPPEERSRPQRSEPLRDTQVLAPFEPPPINERMGETPWLLPEVRPDLPPPAPVITRPDWIERPANLAGYYPRRALELGREGVVELDCLVGLDGRLGCAIASETPAGQGFGAAALRIAQDHRMVPATRDGVAVEARYRMRVPFALD
ncbi:MAG: energy transducer TonB [Hyphomonadaceae bacterium]